MLYFISQYGLISNMDIFRKIISMQYAYFLIVLCSIITLCCSLLFFWVILRNIKYTSLLLYIFVRVNYFSYEDTLEGNYSFWPIYSPLREGLKKNVFFIHILWISVLLPPPLTTLADFVIILWNLFIIHIGWPPAPLPPLSTFWIFIIFI